MPCCPTETTAEARLHFDAEAILNEIEVSAVNPATMTPPVTPRRTALATAAATTPATDSSSSSSSSITTAEFLAVVPTPAVAALSLSDPPATSATSDETVMAAEVDVSDQDVFSKYQGHTRKRSVNMEDGLQLRSSVTADVVMPNAEAAVDAEPTVRDASAPVAVDVSAPLADVTMPNADVAVRVEVQAVDTTTSTTTTTAAVDAALGDVPMVGDDAPSASIGVAAVATVVAPADEPVGAPGSTMVADHSVVCAASESLSEWNTAMAVVGAADAATHATEWPVTQVSDGQSVCAQAMSVESGGHTTPDTVAAGSAATANGNGSDSAPATGDTMNL
jgi:hypothetical protein